MNHLKERFNITHFAVVAIIFSSFLISARLASAVPVAPSPTCEIEADVLGVEETKTITPPINAPSQEIERYSINLKILKVFTFRDEGFTTCDSLYQINSEKETILFPDEYNKSPFVVGQRINGRVHFSGDERFHGIFLSNTSVISQLPLESIEVSEKLLQQKYVNDVSSISLQPNQQTYTVQGVKKGKLFFFIPVRLNIQLEVDAITGVVKEIKRPWWSFLVRY